MKISARQALKLVLCSCTRGFTVFVFSEQIFYREHSLGSPYGRPNSASLDGATFVTPFVIIIFLKSYNLSLHH